MDSRHDAVKMGHCYYLLDRLIRPAGDTRTLVIIDCNHRRVEIPDSDRHENPWNGSIQLRYGSVNVMVI